VTLAAVVVVVTEEGVNSEAGVNFSSGTMSAEKGIIPVHSKPLAARPPKAVLFQTSEKISQNLVFMMCSFGFNTFRKHIFVKN
jgi:hypothetical protein